MVRRRRWRSTATRGIEQSKKLVREEDTEWKWSCFRPWETYTADMSIDLTKHHVPNTMLDKIAYYTVKSLRFPTDIFFQLAKKIQLKERQPSYLPEKDPVYSAWMISVLCCMPMKRICCQCYPSRHLSSRLALHVVIVVKAPQEGVGDLAQGRRSSLCSLLHGKTYVQLA
ncbi:uncharacterized protein [Triticum aestivum]|uniref:uncharacterized protein isoform X2 n=1 Tax=Triticum aestivum TaxID=4565 RepID=UPI001D019CD7|nr:uncharacterized protein LOC123159076 isoform X2 [Triticum aestivum]